MDEHEEFKRRCANEVMEQGGSQIFGQLTRQWMDESIKTNYSYHFEWLGRPIIQYPQDIVGTQQLLWDLKPDLVIETGVARGGSLIFYASILELIAQCGGDQGAKVVGVDIDIRPNNKKAIVEHPLSRRIELLEGSSVDPWVVDQVSAMAKSAERVLLCLDSNHTHDHVLEELKLYSPMVTRGSYAIVFDTVLEDFPNDLIKDRPWSNGNNPKTAVIRYLQHLKEFTEVGIDGDPLNFEIDKRIENQLMITVAPSGFLRRC